MKRFLYIVSLPGMRAIWPDAVHCQRTTIETIAQLVRSSYGQCQPSADVLSYNHVRVGVSKTGGGGGNRFGIGHSKRHFCVRRWCKKSYRRCGTLAVFTFIVSKMVEWTPLRACVCVRVCMRVRVSPMETVVRPFISESIYSSVLVEPKTIAIICPAESFFRSNNTMCDKRRSHPLTQHTALSVFCYIQRYTTCLVYTVCMSVPRLH